MRAEAESKTGDNEWVVAIRIRQLGDVLAALEPLRALKAQRPELRIAYVAERAFHPVLHALDFIDLLLPAPPNLDSIGGVSAYWRYLEQIRSLKPSTVIDFHSNPRSALVTILSGAPVRVGYDVRGRRHAYTIVEPRGVKKDGHLVPRSSIMSGFSLVRHVGASAVNDVLPEIPVDDAVVERARAALAAVGVSKSALESSQVVGINPGKPHPTRKWPRDRFVDLARRLAQAHRHVVVMWGPGEEDTAREIARDAGAGVTLAPAFDLETLCGALKCLSILITIDSGLKHLAVSVRIPTLSLSGSTDPREWHMGTQDDRVLWKGLSCSPCRLLDCPFGAPCMDHPTETVLQAFEEMDERIAR